MDLYVGNLPTNLDSEGLKKLSVKKAYQKQPTFKRVFLSIFWREKAAEKI